MPLLTLAGTSAENKTGHYGKVCSRFGMHIGRPLNHFPSNLACCSVLSGDDPVERMIM